MRRHVQEFGVNFELLPCDFGWRATWMGGMDQSVGNHPVFLDPCDQEWVSDLVLAALGLKVHQLTRLNRNWWGRFVSRASLLPGLPHLSELWIRERKILPCVLVSGKVDLTGAEAMLPDPAVKVGGGQC